MVNATSVLILIMILSFAADRLARGALIGLSMSAVWSRRFPDPDPIEDKAAKAAAIRKRQIAYTVMVGALAAVVLWLYRDLRLLFLLTGDRDLAVIDLVVSAVVIMGGSDLINRLVQLSGVNEAMAGPVSTQKATPLEVSGKLELENTRTTST